MNDLKGIVKVEKNIHSKGDKIMYYHVSPIKGLTTLKPCIPNNIMTESLGEDKTIPRVSVAKHVDDCLNALGGLMTEGKTYYVYSVYSNYAYKPSIKLLPDVDETDEYWLLEETACKACYELRKL